MMAPDCDELRCHVSARSDPGGNATEFSSANPRETEAIEALRTANSR